MLKLHLSLLLIVMSCLIRSSLQTAGHLHDVIDIVDLPSLDLANYQFFRNLPSQNPKTAPYANLFLEHFQKKKAVLDYFENLFLGNSPFAKESIIPFDPHFGRAWRPYYERRYGKRGERLIAWLGQGKSLEQLKRVGAIPREFGSYNYPS